MTAREELAESLRRSRAEWLGTVTTEQSATFQADALIAEGWRKMPSRKAVEQALANSWDDATEYEGAVDAILALMDGSNDE